jgi:alkylation response protein AidB-like acyl-CoA dehydrogenase
MTVADNCLGHRTTVFTFSERPNIQCILSRMVRPTICESCLAMRRITPATLQFHRGAISEMIITHPDDPRLGELCARLRAMSPTLERPGGWPGEQLDLCAAGGVFAWFFPASQGGLGWSEVDLIRGYLRLSAACLTTTFVITQGMGACQRIADATGCEALQRDLLPDLIAGRSFATVGISHLTTSRRHLATPVLRAAESQHGFVLDGYSPWVTGATHAQTVVVGATLPDGRQVLLALPTHLPGVTIGPPAELIGLSASQTGPVHCDHVAIDCRWLLAGPVENVMSLGSGAKTGGLQTSTLALGLADEAIGFLEREAVPRHELAEPATVLRAEHDQLREHLLRLAVGEAVCSNQEMRARANSLVLRSSQAALAAAKGAGFVAGHPAGRWCREALFFLVWSCPQPVMAANLCELAGIAT